VRVSGVTYGDLLDTRALLAPIR